MIDGKTYLKEERVIKPITRGTFTVLNCHSQAKKFLPIFYIQLQISMPFFHVDFEFLSRTKGKRFLMFNVQRHQLQSTGQIYHQNIWRVVGHLQYCPLGLYPCLSSLMTGFFIIGDFSTWLSSALWWMVKILKCCLYEAIIYLIIIENQKSPLMSTRRFFHQMKISLKN